MKKQCGTCKWWTRGQEFDGLYYGWKGECVYFCFCLVPSCYKGEHVFSMYEIMGEQCSTYQKQKGGKKK